MNGKILNISDAEEITVGEYSQTNPNNKITAWHLPCGVAVAGAAAVEN